MKSILVELKYRKLCQALDAVGQVFKKILWQMQVRQVLEAADLFGNLLETIFWHIKANKIAQISNFRRQPLQLIVIQPKLLQRWQTSEVWWKFLDLIVTQIQAF